MSDNKGTNKNNIDSCRWIRGRQLGRLNLACQGGLSAEANQLFPIDSAEISSDFVRYTSFFCSAKKRREEKGERGEAKGLSPNGQLSPISFQTIP